MATMSGTPPACHLREGAGFWFNLIAEFLSWGTISGIKDSPGQFVEA